MFFFKQKTAYEMRISDWSSDVCSSDLVRPPSGYDDLALVVRFWKGGRLGLSGVRLRNGHGRPKHRGRSKKHGSRHTDPRRYFVPDHQISSPFLLFLVHKTS